MWAYLKITLAFSTIFATFSCQNHLPGHSGKLLAEVGDSRLYESDLNINLAGNKDSLAIKENLVKDWVKKQLVFKKAMESLSDAEKNKDKDLKDYYQSLMSHEYLSKIALTEADSNVSEKEMLQYYESNQNIFETKGNILKFLDVKVSPQTNDSETSNSAIAPYATVKGKIKGIIISRRKTILMKETENDIYRDGESRKLFEITTDRTKK